MTFLTVGLIICQIAVQLQADKYVPHYSPRIRDHEPPDSRYRDYPSHDRKDFHLPVTFTAPPYERRDHWRDSREYSDRRTFFDDFSHVTPEKALPGLYQFMRSIFTGRDEITSEHPYNNRPTPYKYVTPYSFAPTEPNYIPPPKPIRASVIKLETITRSPIYPPFEYETEKYYPPVKTLLNQVLIENSKARENRSWYVHEPNVDIPPFKPLPVLPKPERVPPTTLRPTHAGFFNEEAQHFYEYYNKTDYKFPESVQDQLPHLNVGEVRIPYVSEKPIPHIFNSPQTETDRHIGYVEDFYPSSDYSTTKTNVLVDIRSGGRRPSVEFVPTTVKSFPGAVEKVKRPSFKYTKKLTAQLDKSPVERVTNLTVLGLSKTEKENVNRYKQVNYVNVRELINYEMDKLGNVTENSSTRPVNFHDELSLDAKILKDTNWDGLIPETSTLPLETTTTTTITTFQTHKTAFWEVQSTETPSSSESTTAVTDQSRPQTTDFTLWPSTAETTDPPTTEYVTEIPAQIHFREKTDAPVKVNFPSERTVFKRRYSRRPKIVNFTPYPATAEEIQKKLTNRSSHFLKRQKPNITLAFGNKNVLKNRQSFGKDEVMKFSDEDVRKRRKEKRRQVYKRLRVTSSERPVQDESL